MSKKRGNASRRLRIVGETPRRCTKLSRWLRMRAHDTFGSRKIHLESPDRHSSMLFCDETRSRIDTTPLRGSPLGTFGTRDASGDAKNGKIAKNAVRRDATRLHDRFGAARNCHGDCACARNLGRHSYIVCSDI